MLKGGRVSKEEVINGYKYSESRRFHALKEMYQNIEAARSLGVPEYKIREKVARKGLSKDLLNDLFQGVYTPKQPGDFFVNRMGEINRDLNQKENINMPNPYFEAMGDINKIINTNRRLDLLTDQLSIVEEVQAAAPVTPVVNPLSNTNPVVNSKIAPSTVAQLGAPGTNTNLTQPLKVEDVFKTGIV
jgi:hypothetical protein